MKLSEAIMLGIGDTNQIFGSFIMTGWGEALDGCCALGAAIRGSTNEHEADRLAENFWKARDFLTTTFPELEKEFNSPEPQSVNHSGNGLFAVIVDLNDTWHWSRERIAMWLASEGL